MLLRSLALSCVLFAASNARADLLGGAIGDLLEFEKVEIIGECYIVGDATFTPSIGVLPVWGTVTGVGDFTCIVSINGGLPEERTATLHMGGYAPDPDGLLSCLSSTFTGYAVIVFDEPLPGGYTAALDRFEANSQGISFWHHGSIVSLGFVAGNNYIEQTPTMFPSEASGEYLASTDTPDACVTGTLSGVAFEGPAPAIITYQIEKKKK